MKKLNKDLIKTGDCWWLRSPGFHGNHASLIDNDGYIFICNLYADNFLCGVRPALIINLESSNLQILDKFELSGYTWIIVDYKLALMENCLKNEEGNIITMPFNKDISKGNVFKDSDIKKYLDEFLHSNPLLNLDCLIQQGYTFKEINKIVQEKSNIKI